VLIQEVTVIYKIIKMAVFFMVEVYFGHKNVKGFLSQIINSKRK
jgi:hypothetical protein